MPENNSISYGENKSIDFNKLRSGLSKKDLGIAGKTQLESIFDRVNTNKAESGEEVLDETELKNFTNEILELSGKDKKLSKRESKKFKINNEKLEDSNNLYSFLDHLSELTSGVKEIIRNDNSETVIYEEGHSIETRKDGTIISSKDGKIEETKPDGTKIITYPDGKTEETKPNGTKTITYPEGKKEIFETKNNTQVRTVLDGNTKYVYSGNTMEKWENNGQKYEHYTKNTNGEYVCDKSTIKTQGENNTEELEETQEQTNNGKTITYKKNGIKTSEIIERDGQRYEANYDQNGYLTGVIVQNNETIGVIAKKFGVDVKDLLAANGNKIKGKYPNVFFKVGESITIPKKGLRADNAALQNRKSSEDAIKEYNIKIAAQEAKRAQEAKEEQEQANVNQTENTQNTQKRTPNNATSGATSTNKSGATPTNNQAATPNSSQGNTPTENNKTHLKYDVETLRYEAKHDAEKIHNQIMDASLNSNTLKILDGFEKEKLAFILSEYDKTYTNSLAKDIDEEWGLDITTVKEKICAKLVEQAKELNIKGVDKSGYQAIKDIPTMENWIKEVSAKIEKAMTTTPSDNVVMSELLADKKDRKVRQDVDAQDIVLKINSYIDVVAQQKNSYKKDYTMTVGTRTPQEKELHNQLQNITPENAAFVIKELNIKNAPKANNELENMLKMVGLKKDENIFTQLNKAINFDDLKKHFYQPIYEKAKSCNLNVTPPEPQKIKTTQQLADWCTILSEQVRIATGNIPKDNNADTRPKESKEKITYPAKISFKLPENANGTAKAFANSLCENKAKLMQQLKIDNDTYNTLAQTAIGIAAQETNFGEQSIRQTGKDSIRVADTLGGLVDGMSGHAWSMGVTQCKLDLYLDESKEPKTARNLKAMGITDKEQLLDPEISAMATVIILSTLNDRLNSDSYRTALDKAQGQYIVEDGYHINPDTEMAEKGQTRAWKNYISKQDALCALWNGSRGKAILNGTYKPAMWSYSRGVNKSTQKYTLVETKEDRKAAKYESDRTRSFKTGSLNGEMGSVVFMPSMYTNGARYKNSNEEISRLETSLKSKGVDNERIQKLTTAMKRGEFGFAFKLQDKEIDSLTNADIDLILKYLNKMQDKLSTNSQINIADGINTNEAGIIRKNYSMDIAKIENEFRNEYLTNHSAVHFANPENPRILDGFSTYNETPNMMVNGARKNFQHTKDKGVNPNTTNGTVSEASLALATNASEYIQETNPTNSKSGLCLTGVKATLKITLKDYYKYSDSEIDTFIKDMEKYGNTPKMVHKFFKNHPEMFTPVEYVSVGENSVREINSSDIYKLPAGHIVIYIPDENSKFKNEAGHIAITNGNGQGYADAIDNLAWGDFDGVRKGKGETGTFVIYKLKDIN